MLDGDASDGRGDTDTGDDGTDDAPLDGGAAADDGSGSGCAAVGCACDGPDSCEVDLVCFAGECTFAECGNGVREADELCDDGNTEAGDGCESDCTTTQLLAVAAAVDNTCVLIEGGQLRCWGANELGQLGLASTETIGDDELPASVDPVALPDPAVAVALGDAHTCAVLIDGGLRCWGDGSFGQLGLASTETVGDDELPTERTDVPVGGPVRELAAGGAHNCARLQDDSLRCWGANAFGQLGYGNTEVIGDDELPVVAGAVPLGGPVRAIATGSRHSCALLTTGELHCWGAGAYGRLGHADTNNLGDDEPAEAAGGLSLLPRGLPPSDQVVELALGSDFSCARFDSGAVLCWGRNSVGQLGQGNGEDLGDDEAPSTAPIIDLPGPAVAISAGRQHVCARLADQRAICWGRNDLGQLGRGDTEFIGDDETPAQAGVLPLGQPVLAIAAGGDHSCAIVMADEGSELRCWGANDSGQLGYGNVATLGDDEPASATGPVELF